MTRLRENCDEKTEVFSPSLVIKLLFLEFSEFLHNYFHIFTEVFPKSILACQQREI